MNNQQLEDDMRADYRAGNFLPSAYKSPKPNLFQQQTDKYLAEGEARDRKVEELNQRIIAFKNNIK